MAAEYNHPLKRALVLHKGEDRQKNPLKVLTGIFHRKSPQVQSRNSSQQLSPIGTKFRLRDVRQQCGKTNFLTPSKVFEIDLNIWKVE